MSKRYTVSFDVFDLHGTLIERARREVFADTSMSAKNKIAKDYSARRTWGHIRIKNFKIDKFVPVAGVEEPTRPTMRKFNIEYSLILRAKNGSGALLYGSSGLPIRRELHKKQIVEANSEGEALRNLLGYWLKIDPSANMARIHVNEIDTTKKGRKKKK